MGYTGAFMWMMQAGMGDTVFAPLYQVLQRRGVKFQFFHRVTNLHVEGDELDRSGDQPPGQSQGRRIRSADPRQRSAVLAERAVV